MASYRHFRIERAPDSASYQPTTGGRGPTRSIPPRSDRPGHAARLRQDLQQTESEAGQQGLVVEREGITLEFSGEPGFELVFEQLDRKAREGIEVMNVRRGPETESATVYVPPGKVANFFRQLDRYAEGSTRGQKLLDSVAQIRLAAVRAFWTDPRAFPTDADQVIWWEVWVRSGNNPQAHDEAFSRFATALADTPFRAGMGYVQFPERLVLLVRGSVNNWSEHPEVMNLIAELRLAKEVPTELIQLTPAEQAQWVADAASRITTASPNAPAVCVLDTGVWRDHPLLQDSLAASDAQAVDPDWGPSDDNGHGTKMAGLALFGQDLQTLIEGNDGHRLTTRLESVKILPPHGSNDPANYGHVTQKGVAQAEATHPRRPRTVCLAVTADDRDQGYPSSWSGAIDEHAAGVLDGHRRLYVVSTGNNSDVVKPEYEYPTSNRVDAGIQDPAQGWNAITVGACTDCVHIRNPDFEGWRPIAPAGGLAPTSRTSMMWAERRWPLKPDLVVEGGNWAIDANSMVSPCTDLELLTTTSASSGRLLDTMRDTSAATAQVARMANLIQAQYPDLWPETVRALLVHSARWTDQMRSEFPSDDQETLHRLLRCYGYGVPDLNRALWSMENQVCLVAEGELQPFRRSESNGNVTSNEMHVHSLPWPTAVLQQMRATDVTVRVTLSYFIEPSPGRRGWSSKFRYQSHGLRFKVRGPLENEETFRQRLSQAYWEEENDRPRRLGEPQDWTLGTRLPNRGSVHSNSWTASAADIANCGEVAVFPVSGWWKERSHLECYHRRARYALVISIETPATDVDLYTPIANQLAITPQVVT